MVSVPGLPNVNTLPLDKIVNLGGLTFHSSWINGTAFNPYGDGFPDDRAFILARYGFGIPNWDAVAYDNVTYPDWGYASAPNTAVDVNTLFKKLASDGWKFFSPNGTDGWLLHTSVSSGISITQPYTDTDFFNIDIRYAYFEPFGQHVVISKLTNTVMSDGYLPLWDQGREAADSISAITSYAPWDTLVLVIDTTGSYASGFRAEGHVRDLFTALIAAGRSNVRVVVTLFSDYPDVSGIITNTTEVPAYLLGTYDGITSTTSSDIFTTLSGIDMGGNGGDTNESQFEAIYLGLVTAEHQGWVTGHRGVIVYTDAASVAVLSPSFLSPLRMAQRNDGLGPFGHPRLGQTSSVTNHPSSRQVNPAPRMGDTNRYR